MVVTSPTSANSALLPTPCTLISAMLSMEGKASESGLLPPTLLMEMPFHGGKGVRKRAIAAHIADGDAIHRELRHGLYAALDGEVAVVIRLHARQRRDQGIRAGAAVRPTHVARQRGQRIAIEAGLNGLRIGGDHARLGFDLHCRRDLADLDA